MGLAGKLGAMGGCRCPRCGKGRMFRSLARDFWGFAKMHPECTQCGQDFRIEPGFYMGASYIHYAFTAVITIAVVLLDHFWLRLSSPWWLVGGALLLNAILFPIGHRYSRMLMLHWFGGVRFDPRAATHTRHVYVDADGTLVEGRDFDTGRAGDFS